MEIKQEFRLSPELEQSLFEEINRRSDQMFSRFLAGSFGFGLFLATFYDTWLIAIAVGGLNLLAYFGTKWLLPYNKLYQYVGASVLAVFMAQFIYQMHGLFEMHFYAFVACTILIAYTNWRLQIPLFVLIVVHHATFAYMQFIGVEGVYFTQLPYMDLLTFFFHAGFAGIIIFTCGFWAYYTEQKVLSDGLRALQAEDTLHHNLQLAEEIRAGNYKNAPEVAGDDPLGLALAGVGNHLLDLRTREDREKYINQGVATLSGLLSQLGASEIPDIAKQVLTAMAKYIGANQATFFLAEKKEQGQTELVLLAGYAFRERKLFSNRVQIGEGLVGQAALEGSPIVMRNLPEDYFSIGSSLGHAAPNQVIAWPLILDHELIGVMEFATFGELEEMKQAFLEEISPRIATTLTIAGAQRTTRALLDASEKLKTELQDSNEHLAEQAELLRHSTNDLMAQNEIVLEAQQALTLKAAQLESASRYKSEFLANMSHELRTPLNSILILAQMLAQNKGNRLSEKETAHAQVIHKAGTDLLTLINDILDLSKIESGKLDIIMEEVRWTEVEGDMAMMFDHVALEKHIRFDRKIQPDLPQSFTSDRVRLEQILKNLLSNAFKFTSAKGSVSLRIFHPEPGKSYRSGLPNGPGQVLAFSVSDTGIGIPKEKQGLIFEAFSQADGTTSRKFGGTGLGLSISMQLARLLGGEIELQSEEGKGSTFTLYLPAQKTGSGGNASLQNTPRQEKSSRHPLKATILSVEDQLPQSDMLVELLNGHGMTCLPARSGKEALAILQKAEKIDALLLDMKLPDMPGMQILQSVKADKRFVSLPVIIHTSMDMDREMQVEILEYTDSVIVKTTQSASRIIDELYRLIGNGQVGPGTAPHAACLALPDLEKGWEEKADVPVYDALRRADLLASVRALIVDDDMRNIFALSALLEAQGIEIDLAYNGKEALAFLESNKTDIILMDIMMPEMDGYEAIRAIRQNSCIREIPIIAVTAKSMAGDRELCIEAGASAYLPKPLDTDSVLNQMCALLEAKRESLPV